MSTWEDRMALNAAVRAQAAQAEEERIARQEHARLVAEGIILEDEDYMTDVPHKGHASHWHFGAVVCSCGVTLGLSCVALTDEDFDEPLPPCPVCAARGITWG